MKTHRRVARLAVSLLLSGLLTAHYLSPVQAQETSDDVGTNNTVFLLLLNVSHLPVNLLDFDGPDSKIAPSLLEQALIDHLKTSPGYVEQEIDTFLVQNEEWVEIEASAIAPLPPSSPEQPYELHGFRKYSLGDERYVFFAEDGFFIVAEAERADGGDLQPSSINEWTQVRSYTHSLFTWVGKISSITVQGQCEYNVPGAPRPNLVNAWHSRSFWGGVFFVNHWSSGTTKWSLHGHPWATIYAQANFQAGIHYEGNGWVWLNYWMRSELRCADTGLIFGRGDIWQ